MAVDQTVSFLRSASEIISSDDQVHWNSLAKAFSDVLVCLQQRYSDLLARPTTITQVQCSINRTGEPGRPSFEIPSEMIEDLRGYGFSWTKIADMLGISRWTVYRRVRELGLQSLSEFNLISDSELDAIITDYTNRHGTASGHAYIVGYLCSLVAYEFKEAEFEKACQDLIPKTHFIDGECWSSEESSMYLGPILFLDGHHSLIRWSFVVHGCIDGFSRTIIFLQCSPNNLSETVLSLFLNAIEKDGGLWPSRIRVDKGVENVLVCDAMVEATVHQKTPPPENPNEPDRHQI